MNKTIKKIVALGMGATMLAGTAAMALATDLSNYPSPFVDNGVFVGKIVIGEKAGSIDTIGALDIAASLQRSSAVTVATGNTATQVEGSLRLDTSSDRIYYGEGISVDSATGNDLAMLKDGSFEDDAGTAYDYTQSIVFSKSKTITYGHADGSSDADAFLSLDVGTDAHNAPLYTANVDFTKAVNTTNTDVFGNKITLFGNEYTFSADSSVSAGKVVLYGSSQEVSLGMGDEVTKTVGGKEYKIKLIGFTSGTPAKVSVQVEGYPAQSIAQDATKTFGTGATALKVYAKSVDSWDGGTIGTTGVATLQLGAEKITLQNASSVMVGSAETDVEGTYVLLGGNPGALTYIHVGVAAVDSDVDFLKAGGSFVDPVFKTFKIVYSGNTADLKGASSDKIEVAESGSSRIVAKIPTADSVKTLNFNYEGALKWDSTKKILPIEGAAASENDYTYLAPADQKYTHLVQVSKIKTHLTQGYVEYKDVLNGQTYKTNEGKFDTLGSTLSLTVDGKAYEVKLADATAGAEKAAVFYPDSQIVVYPEIELKNGETFFFTSTLGASDMPYGGFAVATNAVFPGGQNGLVVTADITGTVTPTGTAIGGYAITDNTTVVSAITPAIGSGTPTLNVKEAKDYLNAYQVISVPTNLVSSNPGIANTVISGADSGPQTMTDNDLNTYVDYFGTYAEKYTPSGDDGDRVTLYVPADQVYANVFLAPLAAAVTTTTSSTGAVSLNPIALGMAILDTDATLGGKTPYIVVGGPCSNTVAMTLMGANATNCVAGFTEGKAMIKLFADQNALLVAGYTGKDTQGACRVVAAYKDYAFSGTELEVVTTNLNSLTVKKLSS